MTSIIVKFILDNWEDILISLATGAIFYYLGRKKISEQISSISSTDRLIILLGFAVFIITMYILIYNIERYSVLVFIYIISYWIGLDLMNQRTNKKI